MSWTDAPSPEQAGLIRKLGGDPTLCETRREASDLISHLQQNRPASTVDPDLTPGVYEVDGIVYIVKPNKDKSRLYAKVLTETGGTRITEAGVEVPEIDFAYARGSIYKIKATDKMDVERAKALTARYGRCIVCGRWLSAAQSVERGIGPVCIKSFRDAVPATVSGVNAVGEEWTAPAGKPERSTVGVAAPAHMRRPAAAVAPSEEPEVAQDIDRRASAARKLIASGLQALCMEADLDPQDAADTLATFDALVDGYER